MTTKPGFRQRLSLYIRNAPVTRTPILRAMSLLRRLQWAPHGVYTLCYHHVPAEHGENFARQLAHFARNGTFVSADKAVELVRSGKARNGRYFVVSFDDGYDDMIDVALPALVSRRVPAMAFVVPAWLRRTRSAGPSGRQMSRTDLAAWRESGMDVGSHTQSHRKLAELADDEARYELSRSAEVLTELTGEAPRHFASPWGVPGRDFRPERDTRLAKAAGYRSFFTTQRGVATGPEQLWRMPRHVVEPYWPLHVIDALVGGFPMSQSLPSRSSRMETSTARSGQGG